MWWPRAIFFTITALAVAVSFGLLPQAVHGANILGLFTSLSPSHLIIHMSMAQTLSEMGHNVTTVSTVAPLFPVPPNITHIHLPISERHQLYFKNLVANLTERKLQRFNIWNLLEKHKMVLEAQYEIMLDRRFTTLYEQKFELVVLGYFLNVFQLGVAAKFDCPVIMNWVGGPLDMTDSLTGNPSEISYVPTLYMPNQRAEDLNFRKRLEFFIAHMQIRLDVFLVERQMEKYYNILYANETNFPSYYDMKKRISLFFSNYHAISEGPIRPIVPAMIEVGGLQIKEQPDPLPNDVADFLQRAKHGAILLSLGSNVKGAFLKPAVVDAFYKALSSLKQHVIWKWEDLDRIPGAAPNILYERWVPQDDILAHPNTKLFVTHAGKGGVAEAQYHAVPMLAIPAFGDQPGLTDNMVAAGFGLKLDLLNVTEAQLRATIVELLENPKYAKNIKKFSDLYRDRPLTARQSVRYWTEYVLRHKGALHLQTPLLHLSFIEQHNLDIFALILLLLYAIWSLAKVILRLILRKRLSAKSKAKKHKSH